MLTSTGSGGCANYARVKKETATDGESVGSFVWQVFAVQICSALHNNPKFVEDYERCHENARVNGQFFSPNGGKTWFLAFYVKSPWQRKFVGCTDGWMHG